MSRPKPPVSAWIIRERKRLRLKPVDLARQLTAMGLPTAEGTPRTWEAGRSPSPDNIEGLEKIFGSRSPVAGSGLDGTVQPELAALIEAQTAALREQTAAFLKLAASIEAATCHVIQRIDDVEDALVDLGEALRTPATDENGGVADDVHAPSSGRR